MQHRLLQCGWLRDWHYVDKGIEYDPSTHAYGCGRFDGRLHSERLELRDSSLFPALLQL
jgi:hypothetical protein